MQEGNRERRAPRYKAASDRAAAARTGRGTRLGKDAVLPARKRREARVGLATVQSLQELAGWLVLHFLLYTLWYLLNFFMSMYYLKKKRKIITR